MMKRLSQFSLGVLLVLLFAVPRGAALAQAAPSVLAPLFSTAEAVMAVAQISQRQADLFEQLAVRKEAEVAAVAEDEAIMVDLSDQAEAAVAEVSVVEAVAVEAIDTQEEAEAVTEVEVPPDEVVVETADLESSEQSSTTKKKVGKKQSSSISKWGKKSGSSSKSGEAEAAKEGTESAQITVTLSVSSPVGGSYTVTVDDGATVESVMQAARSSGFQYSAKGFSGLGSYVESVGGVEEDLSAGMYWILLVNGSKSYRGISTATVNEGDTIYWSYEKSY